jgi:hypothetical protein
MYKKLINIIPVITTVLMFGFSASAYGEGGKDVTVMNISGNAEVMESGASSWIPALSGMKLGSGDTIRTKENSHLDLDFGGKAQAAVVRIAEKSSLKIDTYIASDKIEGRKITLDLAVGEVLVKVNKVKDESQFQVRTPTSIVGVRGTMFKVRTSQSE